ncbi:PH domain-containing protein [Trichonephila clavipes]|nr:PH domain-containing protein [Trichonephila clavipes]
MLQHQGENPTGLWSGREKNKRRKCMTRERVENREGSLGYPGFAKPVFTEDRKPLGKRKRSLGYLGIGIDPYLPKEVSSLSSMGEDATSHGVWKKRCVAIQPDEFADDPSNPCLVLSVYSGESGAARKHSASFWKSVSCHKAVVYRSSSRTHKYAFTVSDDQGAVVHLSAESEALAQEWMVAIRAILWPPSPVVQLEKMLNGCQFEISIIDNDFSFRAGLLGAYGHLTITPRKLILVHPQQGYVVQEWYLNTVDKFQLVPQTRIEDVNKVLAMTTCSDSSTGRGDILIFCREAVGLLQAVASTIHSILTQHSTEDGGTYQKELEEIGQWLDLPQPQEDYYKVPPRQESLFRFGFQCDISNVCRMGRSTLNLSRLKHPAVDVVWELGEGVPAQVYPRPLTTIQNYEVRRPRGFRERR